MLEAAPEDQKHIHHFLAANCFGDYVSRSGIDLATRELLTFSMLISLNNSFRLRLQANKIRIGAAAG
jgi:alkylhydroperoxidase/carboxymuconolactone decarboxylase family protein YurZ